jgi:hypothetical protein
MLWKRYNQAFKNVTGMFFRRNLFDYEKDIFTVIRIVAVGM